MKNPSATKYVLAILPVAITVLGWILARSAYTYFECTGSLKYMRPCDIGSFNLLPLLGLGLFWCPALLWITTPISFSLLIKVWRGTDKTKSIE